MVERVKSSYTQAVEDLILETKNFKVKEDNIFDNVKNLINNCCITNGNNDVVEFNKKKFLDEVDKLRNIKRHNLYVKGDPLSGWDFFETWEFINFIRDKYPDAMKNFLKEYKEGKYSYNGK